MAWSDLNALLLTVEDGTALICRVWHPKAPPIWHGKYSGAPTFDGAPAYQLSNGTIVTL